MVLDESLLPEAELLEDDDDEEAELPEGDGDKEAEEAAAPKLRKPPFFRFNAELKPRAQRVAPGFVSNAHEYSGPLLGEVRCFHGMTLGELANATRVAQHHLQNIEREQYDSLPATVYLRGYLKSVARELGLDMQRVSQSYLERMQQTKS
jgi:DNA-binding XRE family transcriptional regulator